MARVSTYLIKVNKLAGTSEGSTAVSTAKGVYTFNGKFVPVKRICANEGLEVVWDVWETLLQADDFSIEATGGNLINELPVDSYGIDYDSIRHYLDYDIEPSSIGPNNTTDKKTHKVVVTQSLTNRRIELLCTQESNSQLNTTYSNPEVTEVQVEEVEAVGGDVSLYVGFKQIKTTYYANGTSKSETIVSSTMATNLSGTGKYGASSIGDYIRVPNAGSDIYSTSRTVFTVDSFTITANGKSITINDAGVVVKQGPNEPSGYRYDNYVLDITSVEEGHQIPSSDTIVYIDVESHRKKYTTYTSGYEDNGVVENIEAVLTTSDGTFTSGSNVLNSITILGGKRATFIPYANSGNSTRTITVSARSSANATIKDSIRFTQAAAEYEFKVSPTEIDVPYSGGTKEITVVTTINGTYTEKPSVTLNSGAAQVSSITLNDVLMNGYIISIRVNANTGSARTIQATITQPGSNEQVVVNLNQAAKPSSGGGGSGTTTNARATIKAYFLGGDYGAVRANIELNEDAVTLGKTKNIIVELQNVINDVIDSYTNSYPVSSSFENTLANGNMESDVWVVVKCDNKELGRHKVEE